MPEAAGHLAVLSYEAAMQQEGETVLNWHGCVRGLCLRANHGMMEAQVEVNLTLIRRFMVGLRNKEVGHKMCDFHPQTYTQAKDLAARMMSNNVTF